MNSKRENRLSERKCSYCDVYGHTIRTCNTRKEELSYAEKINAKGRTDAFELMKKVGFSIGALVEIKHRDFKKIDSIANPEDSAITEIFTISKIRWCSVNKTLIHQSITSKIKNYIRERAGMTENYANVILISPNYPDGYAITVTAEKIKMLLKQKNPFSLENNVIGDFCIHDPGDWQETIKDIPEDFFKGRFYTTTGQQII